jgi:hypothetical protein
MRAIGFNHLSIVCHVVKTLGALDNVTFRNSVNVLPDGRAQIIPAFRRRKMQPKAAFRI